MRRRRHGNRVLVLIGLIPIALIGTAVTATNTVPASQLGQRVLTTTPNALKPSACSATNVTTKVVGNGTFSGTNGANLIASGAGSDSISALGGNDCILGGAGDDTIDGGAGTDICIGGPGTDNFRNCETVIQ